MGDGLGVNDFVLTPSISGSVEGDVWSVNWHFHAESGTGSNTWGIRPVIIPNQQDHRDNWELFDVPAGAHGALCPYFITDADIGGEADPLTTFLFQVPNHLEDLGFEFVRSGAGDRVIRVDVARVN